MNKIARYEMIELLIPAGAGNKVSFTDIPQLRTQGDQTIFVKGIDCFTINTYAGSQLNQGITGLTAAELAKAVLVLYFLGEERVHYMPLAKLVTIASDPAAFIPYNVLETDFDDLAKINWTMSYINFSSAPAGTPYIIPLGVTYLKIAVNPTT